MWRGVNSMVRKGDSTRIKSLKWCFYCQTSIEQVDVDHIFPVLLGGNSHPSNLTGACSLCNSFKSKFTIDQFLERLETKRDWIYNKVLSYTGYLRRIRKGRKCVYDIPYLHRKIKEFRLKHSYFTRIINSLINKKYILNG